MKTTSHNYKVTNNSLLPTSKSPKTTSRWDCIHFLYGKYPAKLVQLPPESGQNYKLSVSM